MKTDDEQYRRFLSCDQAALDELLIRHGDALTFYLNGYLHDLQDAEDLMIEAFAQIMAKRPAIREGGFQAYLYKTARNLAARFAVKKRRMIPFSPEDLPEESFREMLPQGEASGNRLSGADLELQPEEALLKAEQRAVLYRCMTRLEPLQREALWLFYMDGLRYEQAAKVLGVSIKKIDNLLTRGRQVLRAEMEKEGISRAYE